MGGVLAVDVGGTFTDLVHWDGAALSTGKEPSTPADQSAGVMEGAARQPPAGRFLHGTTVATNALLERRGAVTALVTSPGFTDVIEIGRQHRPSLYDSFADRPEPLVPRHLRFDGPGEGGTWTPPEALAAAEAVAVSLLYGYAHPEREQAVAAALRRTSPGTAVSLSSDVAPEFREFERTATTVLNAYLGPECGRYLDRLVTRCRQEGLPEAILVMRSSGGLIPIAEAARVPAAILLSGPAGGVTAAAALGDVTGRNRLVSFDMGGTSTDVCRIEGGRPEVSYEREIDGFPCRMPSVAIHTVGAGGGSIAWCDEGGALRVGPRSAGADPGPASYARGGEEPTVTDANVVLARISSQARLAGSLALDGGLAVAALEVLGDRLGLDAIAAARGVTRVVEEVMAAAIRKVSLEEGADPRTATLVAFGGAGGLHATALARGLDMAGVLVPLRAGVFSALGLLVSPPRVDIAQSRLLEDGAGLEPLAGEVADRAAAALAADTGSTPAALHVYMDVRYRGQSHEVAVPYRRGEGWDVLTGRFHELHAERNGFARPGDPIEVVTGRAEAVGVPAVDFASIPVPPPEGPAHAGTRSVAAVAEEMGASSGARLFSPNIKERADCSAAVFTAERRDAGPGRAHPGAPRVDAGVGAAVFDAFGDLGPGDPVRGERPLRRGHPPQRPDAGRPVFVDGRLVGWVGEPGPPRRRRR
jgi:N-methylhydantoinase A